MDAKHYPLRGVTTVSVTVCGSLCLCDGPSGLHASVRRHVGRSTTLCIAMAYAMLCAMKRCRARPLAARHCYLILNVTTYDFALSSNVRCLMMKGLCC